MEAVCAKRKSSLSSNNLQEATQVYQPLFSSSLSIIYGSKIIYNHIIHINDDDIKAFIRIQLYFFFLLIALTFSNRSVRLATPAKNIPMSHTTS